MGANITIVIGSPMERIAGRTNRKNIPVYRQNVQADKRGEAGMFWEFILEL